MRRTQWNWKELAIVALAMALAWGLRGQHGHERGAAMVGAMAGLALSVVTHGPRWIGAAVIGSFGFAIGGALSYGRFVQPAFEGSWEAVAALGLVGFAWGGLGCLGLGLGLAMSSYRLWERVSIGSILFFVWILVDRLLWGRIQGPTDLATRELMAVILVGTWLLLAAYVGIWREDKVSIRLGLAGGIGFAVGFPLAAWIQGVGQASGIPIDWWKVSEHTIGLCGGLGLGLAALTAKSTWTLPLAVRPWERWMGFTFLLWLLPTWLIANNLDFWIAERALLPVIVSKIVWSLLFLILFGLVGWGMVEIRRGRRFVTSWMPNQLRALFLLFLWMTTTIGCLKTIVIGDWNPTPLMFLGFAAAITWVLRSQQVPLPEA